MACKAKQTLSCSVNGYLLFREQESRGASSIGHRQKSKEPGLDLLSTDGESGFFFFLSCKNFIMMQYSDCFTFI